MITKKSIWSAVILLIFCMVILGVFIFKSPRFSSEGKPTKHTPNKEMLSRAASLVRVTTNPAFDYSYDIMTKGVLQHLDRDYTYDIIPTQLEGGLLFQGIHRPPKGTTIDFEIFEPTTVSFFFHSTVDGGYSKIFKNLNGWILASPSPQYDIHNGDHGLDMTLYQLEAKPGTYSIPATTKDRACFSIVFQKK